MKKTEYSVLKEIREIRGMTRKEVAELSGISLRSLQDYEQGHKDIASAKADTLRRLSQVLDCSMEMLLTKETVRERPGEADWIVYAGKKSFVIEICRKEDATERNRRLLAYYRGIMGCHVRQIQSYRFKSPQYKVNGRWSLEDDGWYLRFSYDGEEVAKPFDLKFSDDMIPWLKEVAGLMIDSYVRQRNSENLESMAKGV